LHPIKIEHTGANLNRDTNFRCKSVNLVLER